MEDTSRNYPGAAEHLMDLALKGRLSKERLVGLLARSKRQAYLDACTAVERRFTEECTATGDPCLEGGCAVEGEVCLQPIQRAETDYLKAVGQEWAKMFADPQNRSETYQTESPA